MKRLTAENWVEIDPIVASGAFVSLSLADGSVRTIQAEDWVGRTLAPELSTNVPPAIHELFDIARGAMLYGVFFYPLFTLGLEQMFRVLEAAARARSAALGLRVKNRRYEDVLSDLRANGAISESDHGEWTLRRRVRNLTTHADRAAIILPMQALHELAYVAESINRLFEKDGSV
jgi:hypothetical protein